MKRIQKVVFLVFLVSAVSAHATEGYEVCYGMHDMLHVKGLIEFESKGCLHGGQKVIVTECRVDGKVVPATVNNICPAGAPATEGIECDVEVDGTTQTADGDWLCNKHTAHYVGTQKQVGVMAGVGRANGSCSVPGMCIEFTGSNFSSKEEVLKFCKESKGRFEASTCAQKEMSGYCIMQEKMVIEMRHYYLKSYVMPGINKKWSDVVPQTGKTWAESNCNGGHFVPLP